MGGLLDSMGGEEQEKVPKVRSADLTKMIPDARKDMNDLKRDRRKRNIGDIFKARSKRIDLQVQMTEALNNPFGTKVKFEQITDSKALKDLMI